METKAELKNDNGSEFRQVQRRLCLGAIVASVLIAFVFICLNEKAIAKGLVLGTCFSIINFVLLSKTIPITLGRSRHKAGLIGLASILSRYSLLAIPLIVALKADSFNFIAVVIGIFAVQIVTLVDYIMIRPALEGK